MFKPIDNDAIWPTIAAERTRVYEYLLTLTEDQWNQQSLCDGWLVRDVVSHLIIEFKYSLLPSVMPFIRSGFKINTFIKNTAIDTGKKSRQELLEMYASTIHERIVPKGLSPFNALADLLIHEQDIRVALGDTQPMPLKPLRLIFSNWDLSTYNLGEKITGVEKRVKNIQFVVEDLALTIGSGDEVRGNAQDILLAITGRKVTLSKLSGKGTYVLKNRIS